MTLGDGVVYPGRVSQGKMVEREGSDKEQFTIDLNDSCEQGSGVLPGGLLGGQAERGTRVRPLVDPPLAGVIEFWCNVDWRAVTGPGGPILSYICLLICFEVLRL